MELKLHKYKECVTVYVDVGNGVKCTIARFDCLKINNKQYLTREEALEEAELFIKKYKNKEK